MKKEFLTKKNFVTKNFLTKKKKFWQKNFFKKIKDLKSVKTVKSEYLNWLLLANAGMLHKGNIYCLDFAVQNLPSNNPVIEIGSFCGLSTNVISYLLSKYDCTPKHNL